MLEDGTYDVLVVDAGELDDPPGAIRIDVTILAGDAKGEVVTLTAVGLGREALDLLAEPGVLTVADGRPRFALDD